MHKRILAMAVMATAAVSAMSATIDVKGAVKAPGTVEWTQGLTVRQAIAAAGGLSASADPMAVQVIESDGGKIAVDLSKLGPTPVLNAGDRVEVPEFDSARYVTIAGAVAKPGAVPFREGLTVGEALKTAQPFDQVTSGTVKIVGKDGVRELPKGITEADLFAMTVAPGEVINVKYPAESFSNRELLIGIAIVVILLLLLK